LEDDGTTTPYERTIADKIERARLGEIVKFEKGLSSYEVEKLDGKLGFEINKSTKKKRLVQRKVIESQASPIKNQNSFPMKNSTFESSSTNSGKYIWEWESDTDSCTYTPYDSTLSQQLENIKPSTELRIKIGVIDYTLMKVGDDKGLQRNMKSGNFRNFRRREI